MYQLIFFIWDFQIIKWNFLYIFLFSTIIVQVLNIYTIETWLSGLKGWHVNFMEMVHIMKKSG
jgi:hypothetical protein